MPRRRRADRRPGLRARRRGPIRGGPAALAQTLTNCIRPLPDLVVNAEVARWSRRLRYAEGQLSALRATAPLIAAMPPVHVARQVARLAVARGYDVVVSNSR